MITRISWLHANGCFDPSLFAYVAISFTYRCYPAKRALPAMLTPFWQDILDIRCNRWHYLKHRKMNSIDPIKQLFHLLTIAIHRHLWMHLVVVKVFIHKLELISNSLAKVSFPCNVSVDAMSCHQCSTVPPMLSFTMPFISLFVHSLQWA